MAYEDVVPTLVENTTMRKYINSNGEHVAYHITPNTGYVLHDKGMDDPVLDEEGNETGVILLSYRTSTASCGANYDFEANPREFYAVLATEVPEDRIFGVVNKPEIM